MAIAIDLPNEWEAREYQIPLFDHMFGGTGLERKRAACVWHRRGGKDSCCLQLSAVASQIRVGTIWHMLPTLKQGKKVIWEGVDYLGRRMIDQAFPKEMRHRINNSDMQIEMKNGSFYQVVGSDNYDSLIGANPVGVIFSEWAVADPAAWDYIRPILAENGGWALFIYTPRGHNHGEELWKMARDSERWFSSVLTVDNTVREDGITPVIGPDIISEERADGMSEEKIQQEYYCSFESGLEGAYYTEELNQARDDGRIGVFPYDPLKPVQTWWDIGWRDDTAIIFTQRNANGKPAIIDFTSNRNKALDWWVREVFTKPYVYDQHSGPHDLENTDWTTGKTRREFAQGLGLDFDIVPKLFVPDGIDATKALIRVCTINESTCKDLLNALYSYRREFDEKAKIFRDKPVHDWSSHPSDAMRYLSVGWTDYGGDQRIVIADKYMVHRTVGGQGKSFINRGPAKGRRVRRSVGAS